MKAVSKLFLSIVLLSSIVFQCCINPSLATDTFSERDTYVEIEQQHSEEPLSDITDTTRIVFDADTSETTGVSEASVASDITTVADDTEYISEDESSIDCTECTEETTGIPDAGETVEEMSSPEETTVVFDETTMVDEEIIEAVESSDVTDTQDTTSEFPETEVSSYNALTKVVTRDDGAWLWPVGSNYSFSDYAGCDRTSCHTNVHNGVDIACGTSAVYATRDGILYFDKGMGDYNFGRGITVVIEHQYTSTHSYYSVYQHLIEYPDDDENVSISGTGISVNAGQQIGRSGTTGNVTGPHLHFSILIAPKGKGQTLAYDVNGISNIEHNGWIYDNTIPAGGGMVVTNPKYPNDSDILSHINTTNGDYAAFCANPGSVTYVFDKNIVATESSINSQYKRLIISTGGGTFGDPAGYAIACQFSASGSYSPTSAIVKTTPRSVVYLNSVGCGISVNFMGIVVDYVNNGTGVLVVPQNGFVVAIGNGHERYQNIQSFVGQVAGGATKYCWMQGAYLSHTSTYNRYGALVGKMYRIKGADDQVGLSDYVPEKSGYLFCGWRNPSNGIIFSPTREVPLTYDVTTIEAVWRKKLVFNLNGGSFSGIAGYGLGSADAVSGTFASNKTIIYSYASTGPLSLYFNSTCTAVAVDCKGCVVAYIYQSTGEIRIPYNGFLIVSGSGSAKYNSISNLVNNIRSGTTYWFWRSGIDMYVTGTHTSYGAFNGYQFAEDNEAAITTFIPVKSGKTFSHWLSSDGKIYEPGARVDVFGSHTVTLTAIWT